jgi:hypothetical protein
MERLNSSEGDILERKLGFEMFTAALGGVGGEGGWRFWR